MNIRKGPRGHIMGSHFASVIMSSSFVVNGYSLAAATESQTPHPNGGSVTVAMKTDDSMMLQGGVPLPRNELHGLGGGSFANHSLYPNAEFRQHDTAATGPCPFFIVLVATKLIKPGDFVRINYGTRFLSSEISNIREFESEE